MLQGATLHLLRLLRRCLLLLLRLVLLLVHLLLLPLLLLRAGLRRRLAQGAHSADGRHFLHGRCRYAAAALAAGPPHGQSAIRQADAAGRGRAAPSPPAAAGPRRRHGLLLLLLLPLQHELRLLLLLVLLLLLLRLVVLLHEQGCRLVLVLRRP